MFWDSYSEENVDWRIIALPLGGLLSAFACCPVLRNEAVPNPVVSPADLEPILTRFLFLPTAPLRQLMIIAPSYTMKLKGHTAQYTRTERSPTKRLQASVLHEFHGIYRSGTKEIGSIVWLLACK